MRLEVIETEVGGKNVRKDGSVGQCLASEKVKVAVEAGQKKFPRLSIPALTIFYEGGDDANVFEGGNPRAEVVTLRRANHYVFLSNEAEVLHSMESFFQRTALRPVSQKDGSVCSQTVYRSSK